MRLAPGVSVWTLEAHRGHGLLHLLIETIPHKACCCICRLDQSDPGLLAVPGQPTALETLLGMPYKPPSADTHAQGGAGKGPHAESVEKNTAAGDSGHQLPCGVWAVRLAGCMHSMLEQVTAVTCCAHLSLHCR